MSYRASADTRQRLLEYAARKDANKTFPETSPLLPCFLQQTVAADPVKFVDQGLALCNHALSHTFSRSHHWLASVTYIG